MCSERRFHSRGGFTLVELLVVIGIIALLISILLPSLNQARQSANVIDCAARIRQMGLGIQMYVNESKGKLPFSIETTGAPWDGRWLPNTITAQFKKIPVPNYDTGHPIFADKDVHYAAGWWKKGQVHYTFNPGLFPDVGMTDVVTGKPCKTQLVASKIKNSAAVIAAWDAMPSMGYDYNSVYADGIYDGPIHVAGTHAVWFSCAMRTNVPAYMNFYDNQIPRIRNANITPSDSVHGHPDFRHLVTRNMGTALNALFLDGHVETRKVGNLQVKELCFDHGDGRG